ncbi:ankyrin repeat-containing domain protein [Aspergillus crustosus]
MPGLQEDLNWLLHVVAGDRGHCGIIQMLCDFGANPLATPTSMTVLSSAALQGHIDAMRRALEYGIDPNARTTSGETALHRAARYWQLEPIQLLLSAGANIEATSIPGMTPLLSAANRGSLAAAEFLLDAGANIHARNVNRFTIIELATVRDTSLEMITLFLQRGAKPLPSTNADRMTALHWAARVGNTALVQVLCGAGFKVDTLDQRGRTALHLAVRENHQSTVTALLQAGADPSTSYRS